MFSPSRLIKREKSWRPESVPFRRLEELLPTDDGRRAMATLSTKRYLEGLRNHGLELIPNLRRTFMKGANLRVE